MATLRTLVMGLYVSATLIQLAAAANYVVGGTNGGWDTSTDLQTWASSQSFSVGDKLIFQYAANHDVAEVSKADYDSCRASNAIQSYNGGTTTIPLSSPGKRYFICGSPGHCSQGMKLEIDTLASSTPPAASPSVKTPPSPVTPIVPTPAPEPDLVPTPAPESSTSSTTPAPELTPATLLPPSPSDSPTTPAPELPPATLLPPSPSDSPIGLATIPSTESTRTSSDGSSTEPTSSSASKDSFLIHITMGFGFVIMMLHAYLE
ncbi:Blue copper protein [Morella rubra]|uniref:Blue copper protein n=1 Tax=Morella rubra TaxID=262757 RepID=A0A6A1VE76_9ROSI|nr:Blue copper protein [Morella rubra]